MSNVTAMDPQTQLTWAPKCDKELPSEEQLKIYYNPIDMHKEAKISDAQIKSITKGRKSQYNYLIGQADVQRLVLAIVGWDNFNYPDGHEQAGKPCPYCKENITCLPPEIRQEFIEDLTGRKRLADEEDDNDEGNDLGEAKVA